MLKRGKNYSQMKKSLYQIVLSNFDKKWESNTDVELEIDSKMQWNEKEKKNT